MALSGVKSSDECKLNINGWEKQCVCMCRCVHVKKGGGEGKGCLFKWYTKIREMLILDESG